MLLTHKGSHVGSHVISIYVRLNGIQVCSLSPHFTPDYSTFHRGSFVDI